ncbi:hypothetical protein WJX81_007854 [Elliptochloris bilobata]|uniref:Uncharacterized protein n=1 Tax=Elliptochloris bilobata TaxID=381761 RepID=A0AAW1R076_9CHLO
MAAAEARGLQTVTGQELTAELCEDLMYSLTKATAYKQIQLYCHDDFRLAVLSKYELDWGQDFSLEVDMDPGSDAEDVHDAETYWITLTLWPPVRSMQLRARDLRARYLLRRCERRYNLSTRMRYYDSYRELCQAVTSADDIDGLYCSDEDIPGHDMSYSSTDRGSDEDTPIYAQDDEEVGCLEMDGGMEAF